MFTPIAFDLFSYLQKNLSDVKFNTKQEVNCRLARLCRKIYLSFIFFLFNFWHQLDIPERKKVRWSERKIQSFFPSPSCCREIYRKVHLKPVYSRWISIFFELCRQAFVLMHTGRPEWLFDIRFVYSLFPLCITPRGIATSHFLSLTAFSLLWTGNHYLTINICRLSYFLQCASAITKFSKI